jgi:hypothetical protein
MKKALLSVLIGLAVVCAWSNAAFADSYWKQYFSQSSTEEYGGAPIGQFDQIAILWQDKAKFTSTPLAEFTKLGGGADADWTISNYSPIYASANSATLKDYAKFAVNFESAFKPTGTDFYYAVFKGGNFVMGQNFKYDGLKWSGAEITEGTWSAAASAVVPEPISASLFLLGSGVLGAVRYTRRKK